MIQLFLPVKPSRFFFIKLDIVIIRNYCLGQTYVNSEILWAFLVHLQYFHFSLIFIQVLLCFCQMLRHNIFRNDINLHVDGRSQLELSIQALKACIEYQGLLLLCTRYRLWICIVLKAILLALPLEHYNLPCRFNLPVKRIGFVALLSIVLFTGRNEVLAKVIFLHLSVILFTGGVWQGDPPSPGWMEEPPRWRNPPRWRTPPDGGTPTPPPREADSGIRSTIGRYASYWNAFLL